MTSIGLLVSGHGSLSTGLQLFKCNSNQGGVVLAIVENIQRTEVLNDVLYVDVSLGPLPAQSVQAAIWRDTFLYVMLWKRNGDLSGERPRQDRIQGGFLHGDSCSDSLSSARSDTIRVEVDGQRIPLSLDICVDVTQVHHGVLSGDVVNNECFLGSNLLSYLHS